MDTESQRWNIDFGVCKSIRYHSYRRAFWNAWSNFSKILTIISGTAVLVALVADYHTASTVMAFVVAFTSAGDLVLGFSEKARTHDGLYRAFSILAQEIAANESPSPEILTQWRRRRLEIEMDEPTVLDLLERRCAGEEARARGAAVRPAWRLGRCQVMRSQWSFFPAGITDGQSGAP